MPTSISSARARCIPTCATWATTIGFERSRPNALWQLDHKRAVHGRWSRRSVPLVVEDDASRYLVGLRALPDKGLASTWEALWGMFGEFGLPESVLTDNDGVFHGRRGPSQFEARLMRLGISVLHGRPYHPQTQGKVERLNGTLELEVLRDGVFRSAADLQAGYDAFRERYNFERPHEALDLAVPASRYEPSRRVRPARVPPMEYAPGAVLRRVQKDGWISWRGWAISVGADAPSIDSHAEVSRIKVQPAHIVCREREILNMENVANIDLIPRHEFWFVGLPLKLHDATGSPIRAVAITPQN